MKYKQFEQFLQVVDGLCYINRRRSSSVFNCYDPNRRTNKIGGRGQECTELISAGIRKWSINRDQWRMPVIYSSSPHM